MTDAAIQDQSAKPEPGTLRTIWRWVRLPFVILLGLAALASRGHELIYGINVLVALVDTYRGLIYPAVDWVHAHVWPTDWFWPTRPMIDGGLIGAALAAQYIRLAARSFGPSWIPNFLLVIALAVSFAAFYGKADAAMAATAAMGGVVGVAVAALWGGGPVVALALILSGTAVVGVRELNARADVALPIVERWEQAFWDMVEDIEHNGVGYRPKTDDQIRSLIIRDVITSSRESCPCPQDLVDDGSKCGERSAFTRSGGKAPICTPEQISDEQVTRYRQDHGL